MAKLVPRSTGTIPPVPKTGHVSDKIRKAIRKGEVINLALLKPKNLKDPGSKKLRFNIESCRFEEDEVSQDLSFYNWLECFLIYMSIRLEYYPDEAQGLLRHVQNVQSLSKADKDAVEYDLQFRTAKRQHPNIQWGEYLAELVDVLPAPKSVHKGNIKPKTHGMAKWGGVCAKFNTSGCTNTRCRFKHECKSCQGNHSVNACTKRNQ